MKKQKEYTLFRISEQMQKDTDVLLLTAGTLTSQCNRFFLTLSSLELAEPPGISATQRVQLQVVVVDSESNIHLELEASGLPNQCSGYFLKLKSMTSNYYQNPMS